MFKPLLLLVLVLLAGLGRPAGAQHLVAGNHHTLSLHADGTLWAWGLNGNGQVGIGSTASYPATPVAIGAASNWASLAAGSFHSLGLRANGTLWVWGYNGAGELGLGTTIDQPSPVQLGTDTWLSVAGGGSHTLAVRADGTLWAWGNNANGQLGTNTSNQLIPTQVGTATTWKSVGAGYNSSYAIRQDGTLWAWGYNQYGELGLGAAAVGTNQFTPTQVGTASTWASVDGGYNHTLAVKTDGTLWAWGYNNAGQLGLGNTASQPAPTQVGTATTWQSVSAGGYHSTALRFDNSLWSWGDNFYAQVGLATTATQLAPVQVGAGSNWQEVSAGYNHTVALRQDGTVWAWGQTGLAELGNGVGLYTTPVAQTPATQSWLSTSAGDYHSVAVRQDGTLWAWGYNSGGQLGLGSITPPQITPTQVGTAATWQRVVAGTQCTAALRQDGTLWVWGSNNAGQLGLGQAVSTQPVPVQLGTSTWLNVAAGSGFMMAVRADGTLWTWGNNYYGQLGLGSNTGSQYTPVQVGTATTWASVACGTSHVLAVRRDGTLWAWGLNNSGELGLGSSNTANQSAPVQVGTATAWQRVSAGYTHSLAVKTDGTLWAWGSNFYGQLGLGSSAASQYAPVQVGSATTWQSISASNNSSAAVRQDGTLYTWGYNYFAQLGQGNTTLIQPLPTAVGTAHWQQVAVGSYGHMLGIQQSPASLWGWGFNQYGQLAQAYYQAQPTYIAGGGAPLATTPASAPTAWTLAPNPAHDQVQLTGLPAGPVAVRLFDGQGRLVRTAAVPTVPTADLAPGLYLVQATAGATTRTLRLTVE